MKRRVGSLALVAVALALGAVARGGSVTAPMPVYDSSFDLVPFRGHLEKDGLAYSSPVNLTFDLFDGASSTTAGWEETLAGVQPGADGSFSVTLGHNGHLPALPTSKRLGDVLRQLKDLAYVGITVDDGVNPPVTLVGRQRLLAAPFAMRVSGIEPSDLATDQCVNGQFPILGSKTTGQWACNNTLPALSVAALAGGSLSVTGVATLSGGAGINGLSVGSGATITGGLNVNGATSIAGSLTVNGRVAPQVDTGWFYVQSGNGEIAVPYPPGSAPSQVVLQQCGMLPSGAPAQPSLAHPYNGNCASRVVIAGTRGYQAGNILINPQSVTFGFNQFSQAQIFIGMYSGWYAWAYSSGDGAWGCGGSTDTSCYSAYYRVLAWE